MVYNKTLFHTFISNKFIRKYKDFCAFLKRVDLEKEYYYLDFEVFIGECEFASELNWHLGISSKTALIRKY